MLVEHHTKYLELDGVDETIFVPISEHLKLHHHNGSAPQKPELKIDRQMSIHAHKRTLKYKAQQQYYMKKYNPMYKKNNKKVKRFNLTLEPKIYLRIVIELNEKTDKITVYNQIEKRSYGS